MLRFSFCCLRPQMRTSFHHQPEAQHPNFLLSTSWQADYPIFRSEADMHGRVAWTALDVDDPNRTQMGLKSCSAAVSCRTEVCYLWPKPLEAVMAQLTYDELRLLRQLERGDQTISDDQPRGGLNRLVDEGYVMRRLLNPSQTVHSITAKGRAVLHEAEGNDKARLHKLVICGPGPEERDP